MINTDSLKNEEMRDACYIYCDDDPSSTFGTALGKAISQIIVDAITLGLAPSFCHKPEPASK